MLTIITDHHPSCDLQDASLDHLDMVSKTPAKRAMFYMTSLSLLGQNKFHLLLLWPAFKQLEQKSVRCRFRDCTEKHIVGRIVWCFLGPNNADWNVPLAENRRFVSAVCWLKLWQLVFQRNPCGSAMCFKFTKHDYILGGGGWGLNVHTTVRSKENSH